MNKNPYHSYRSSHLLVLFLIEGSFNLNLVMHILFVGVFYFTVHYVFYISQCKTIKLIGRTIGRKPFQVRNSLKRNLTKECSRGKALIQGVLGSHFRWGCHLRKINTNISKQSHILLNFSKLISKAISRLWKNRRSSDRYNSWLVVWSLCCIHGTGSRSNHCVLWYVAIICLSDRH